jgi:hypothetical protein
MRCLAMRALAGVCLFAGVSFSGPRPDPAGIYERIICVVPMIGSGTYHDPRRPQFAPAESSVALAGNTPGFAEAPAIVAFHSVPSDDGLFAIVEFVARDRAAFKPILAANPSAVKVFERGKASKDDLLKELRKFKKDFTLESLQAGVQ